MPLLNTLVKPTIAIPEEAIAIHGITNKMVEGAPSFCMVYPQIVAELANREVLIYNASFDIGILKYCCRLHKLPLLGLGKRMGEAHATRTHCTMEWYAQWYGEWSDYWRSYKWQALCGGHRALGDCLATLNRLKKMAADSPEIKSSLSVKEHE